MTTTEIATTEIATTTNIDGTSLQGTLHATYPVLIACFGLPTDAGDNYKIDARWILKADDGTVVTIYNWKDGFSYCGEDGEPVESIEHWHIGGYTEKSVELVRAAVCKYVDSVESLTGAWDEPGSRPVALTLEV